MTPNTVSQAPHPRGPLDVSAQLGGRRLVVIGGTGFLGKVFWTFLLSKYPDVGHLYLVVRERDKQNARERFWNEIAKNDCLNALQEEHV